MDKQELLGRSVGKYNNLGQPERGEVAAGLPAWRLTWRRVVKVTQAVAAVMILIVAVGLIVANMVGCRKAELIPMTRIKPGEFMMGSSGDEPGRDRNEIPHRVKISRAFLMGVTEVTQAQYETVTGNNSANFNNCGGDCPVEMVSWDDATEFCNRLSKREGLTPCYQGSGDDIQCDFNATGYRLPTEAEWEYGCRAGSETQYNLGNDEKDLERAGWYIANSESKTHSMGLKIANRWGLYDMHGNVWEWCWDRYGEYATPSLASDPRGPSTGSDRVVRGGSRHDGAINCRSARRFISQPGVRLPVLGFRLARSLP